MINPSSFVLVTYQSYRKPKKDEKFHTPDSEVLHHIMSEVALLALAGRALIHGATRVAPKVMRHIEERRRNG